MTNNIITESEEHVTTFRMTSIHGRALLVMEATEGEGDLKLATDGEIFIPREGVVRFVRAMTKWLDGTLPSAPEHSSAFDEEQP